MKARTLEEAAALVGTTWERDGQRREIVRITDLRGGGNYIYGNVYWRRPGGKERSIPQWFPYFNDWLSKSTKVEG